MDFTEKRVKGGTSAVTSAEGSRRRERESLYFKRKVEEEKEKGHSV